jgi:hypothetical protein
MVKINTIFAEWWSATGRGRILHNSIHLNLYTPKSCLIYLLNALVCLLKANFFLPKECRLSPTHWDFALGLCVHVFLHTWFYVIFYGHLLLITVAPCHWRERDPVLPYDDLVISFKICLFC